MKHPIIYDMLITRNLMDTQPEGGKPYGTGFSYGDANQIVVEMGAEVLPAIKHTPVLAGVCGTGREYTGGR